ncbi:MAG: Lar family restriction alleviation protein [Oscillospiraceae bacterium]
MSNEFELKPCPFCGGEEAKLTKCRTGWLFGWHVTCKHCLSVGATAYSDRVGVGAKTPEEKERQMKAYAVANWNRRTTPDHIVATTKKVDDSQPLTMEEIRGMAGEPVWVETFGMWALVYIHGNWDPHLMLGDGSPVLNHPARNHTLYRRKPEGD